MNRKLKIFLSILCIFIGIILFIFTINLAKDNLNNLEVSNNTLIPINSIPKLTIKYIIFIIISITLIIGSIIYLLLSKICLVPIKINKLVIISIILIFILSLISIYYINNNILLHIL